MTDKYTKLKKLQNWFRSKEQVIIAYSGGIDSTFLLKVATETLGKQNALGITSKSESLSDAALKNAKLVAAEHEFNHEIIYYSELAIPNYSDNPTNRCFFCKSELYLRLSELAKQRGVETVIEGSNLDDTTDHQHGIQAAEKQNVESPLKDFGFTKDEIRSLANEMGLPNWDLPSAPCLSSRVPYGQQITEEKLDQVAAGEQYLREQNFTQVRLRNHGDTARLELMPAEMHRIFLEVGLREQVIDYIKSLGFNYVTIDLQGFRSGSLNETIKNK